MSASAKSPAPANAPAGLSPGQPRRKWIEYSTIGLMFPASILVGFAMGFFLDRWLKTEPWLMIVFILYGILAGFYNLFSQTRRHEPKK